MLVEFPHTDFILPQKNIGLLTLQFLSAAVLIDSGDIFVKYVDKIPPNLLPFLLETAIQHSYLKVLVGKINWFTANSLSHLIEFWPYEELILRHHLVAKCISFKFYEVGTFSDVKIKFSRFLQQLVTFIVDVFIFKRLTWKNKRPTIRRLDVSRVGATSEDSISRYYHEVIANGDMNRGPHLTPCELVCDIFLNDLNIAKFVPLIFEDKTWDISPSLTFVFDRISAEGLMYNHTREILNYAKKRGTKYLEFTLCDLRLLSTGLSIDTVPQTLKELRLNCCFAEAILSDRLSFLRQLPNLHQLDLSGIQSRRDGWGILAELQRGLTFLKLTGCSLDRSDLEGLSRHSQTLLQIDLSHTSLQHADIFTAFANFLCSLVKVEIIELESSQLGSAPPHLLVSFIERFLEACPRVKVLHLNGNDFSARFMKAHLVLLVKKESLLYLSLTIPSDAYLGDDYTDVKRFIKDLKNFFDENVNMLPNSQLRVEWEEDAHFSRWYYCI